MANEVYTFARLTRADGPQMRDGRGAPEAGLALAGQGHAARHLRQRAEALLAEGAARLVIDPDPSNERAVRAYRRAGFRDRLLTSTPGGTAVLVMDYDPAAPVAPLLQNHPGPVPDRQNP